MNLIPHDYEYPQATTGAVKGDHENYIICAII